MLLVHCWHVSLLPFRSQSFDSWEQPYNLHVISPRYVASIMGARDNCGVSELTSLSGFPNFSMRCLNAFLQHRQLFYHKNILLRYLKWIISHQNQTHYKFDHKSESLVKMKLFQCLHKVYKKILQLYIFYIAPAKHFPSKFCKKITAIISSHL